VLIVKSVLFESDTVYFLQRNTREHVTLQSCFLTSHYLEEKSRRVPLDSGKSEWIVEKVFAETHFELNNDSYFALVRVPRFSGIIPSYAAKIWWVSTFFGTIWDMYSPMILANVTVMVMRKGDKPATFNPWRSEKQIDTIQLGTRGAMPSGWGRRDKLILETWFRKMSALSWDTTTNEASFTSFWSTVPRPIMRRRQVDRHFENWIASQNLNDFPFNHQTQENDS
jgi:hypothetical protein